MTKNSKKYETLFEYGKLFAKSNTRSYLKLKKEITDKYGKKAAEVFELGFCSMVDAYLEVYSKSSTDDIKKLALMGSLHSWNEETPYINEDYVNDCKKKNR